MDWNKKNGIAQERKYFLSKMKTNPIFLFRHLLSLLNMMWHRCHTTCLIQCYGLHKGAKIHPTWLKSQKKFQQEKSIYDSMIWSTIPERSLPLVSSITPDIHFHQIDSHEKTQDLEDYLAIHRWSILIENVLKGLPGNILPKEIENWLTSPPKKQDAAWETYSTCERIANLLTWISFIPLNKRATSISINMVDFLEESIQWIFSHLELYGEKTNNHIINNARALIMAGITLRHQSAVAAGITILDKMLPILIQPNGSLRERSTHYQLIVFTWLLDIYTFMSTSNNQPFIQKLKKIISLMRSVTASFCDNQGNLLIYIGDISPDLSPYHSSQRLKICYPEWWPVMKSTITYTQQEETEKNTLLAQDDWWILSSKQQKIILNCPIGHYPKSYPSHSHGDIASFVWLYQQEPILIDSGRYRYIKDNISILQKSAQGHTVPLVNGFSPLCESFVICGNWWPTPYATANIQVHHPKFNSIKLSHNGFHRATPVKQHEREIILLEDQITIHDTFKGHGYVHINSIWQLSPIFTSFDQEKWMISSNKIAIVIAVETSNLPLLFYESIDTPGNWYSRQYGRVEPNPTLSIQWQVHLPFKSIITFKVKTCVASLD